MKTTKTILLYKWGRPTDAFVKNNKSNPHVGRGFDLTMELIAKELLENYSITINKIEVCSEGRTDIAEIDKQYISINRSLDGFLKSKADIIVVLGGPDNDEFNKPFVEYVNNYFKGKLVLYTNDHKFLELKGVNKSYEVYSELIYNRKISSKYDANRTIKIRKNPLFNMWLADKLVNENKSNNILILANELHQDFRHSRVPRIIEFCEANKSLHFDLYGLYENDENIKALKSIENLTFVNSQYTHKDLYALMRNYKYSLIIQASKCEGSVYNEDINYPLNYLCLKFYEYLLNGVIPFIDFTDGQEYNLLTSYFINTSDKHSDPFASFLTIQNAYDLDYFVSIIDPLDYFQVVATFYKYLESNNNGFHGIFKNV